MAVQLDPIKPTLKAPGNKRLKLNYGKPLSNYALKFDLRGYIMVEPGEVLRVTPLAAAERKPHLRRRTKRHLFQRSEAAPPSSVAVAAAAGAAGGGGGGGDGAEGGVLRAEKAERQGLTLVPNSAQLEFFCPPCNST
jgi:hypothetical protein